MKLPNEVINLMNSYKNNGYELYLVGGAVRDYLLKRKVNEYDFATTATINESLTFLKYDSIDLYQQIIGSLKIKQGKNEFEITTMRIEIGVENTRYPKQISFTKDIKEDAVRRDFTINAIYYHLDKGYLDPHGGINDLNDRIIRFIKPAEISINEDPIRLIRALRFSLMLNFEINNEDYQAMKELSFMVNTLKQIKYSELYKIFSLDNFPYSVTNHQEIYFKSYPTINQELIKQMIKLNQKYSKYVFFLVFPKNEVLSFINNLKLTKKEIKLIKHLIDYQKIVPSLINVKRNLNLLKEDLELILEIIKPFDEIYYNKMMKYINLIKVNHLCFDKKDLNVSGQDLITMGIPKKEIKLILNELFEIVLNNDDLNKKEILLEIAKKKCE